LNDRVRASAAAHDHLKFRYTFGCDQVPISAAGYGIEGIETLDHCTRGRGIVGRLKAVAWSRPDAGRAASIARHPELGVSRHRGEHVSKQDKVRRMDAARRNLLHAGVSVPETIAVLNKIDEDFAQLWDEQITKRQRGFWTGLGHKP
jgi:hypothetical protein